MCFKKAPVGSWYRSGQYRMTGTAGAGLSKRKYNTNVRKRSHSSCTPKPLGLFRLRGWKEPEKTETYILIYICFKEENLVHISPLLFNFNFLFWPRHGAHGISVPQSGIEPMPHAGGSQSLNRWTIGEVPEKMHFWQELPQSTGSMRCPAAVAGDGVWVRAQQMGLCFWGHEGGRCSLWRLGLGNTVWDHESLSTGRDGSEEGCVCARSVMSDSLRSHGL